MQRIAIVEDAEDNRDLLYYLLREDYDVSRYASGEEALERFKEDPPDLVIMDISLTGMTGVEVLRELRRTPATRNIPAIALTAHAMNGDREKYLSAGFIDYVSKPILDVGDLLDAIRRCLPSHRPNG
jgi:two-component system cell cycle response regulator DivK